MFLVDSNESNVFKCHVDYLSYKEEIPTTLCEDNAAYIAQLKGGCNKTLFPQILLHT